MEDTPGPSGLQQAQPIISTSDHSDSDIESQLPDISLTKDPVCKQIFL